MAGNLWRLQTPVQSIGSVQGLAALLANPDRLLVHDIDVSLKGTVLADPPPKVSILRSIGTGTFPGSAATIVPLTPNAEVPFFGWAARYALPFWLAATETLHEVMLHPKGGSLRRWAPDRFPIPLVVPQWIIVAIENATDYPAVCGITFES